MTLSLYPSLSLYPLRIVLHKHTNIFCKSTKFNLLSVFEREKERERGERGYEIDGGREREREGDSERK